VVTPDGKVYDYILAERRDNGYLVALEAKARTVQDETLRQELLNRIERSKQDIKNTYVHRK
jgi:hypothetical protein